MGSIHIQILLILGCTVLLAIAIFLLSIYKRLFLFIPNFWLRRNLATLTIAIFFMSALLAMQSPEIMANAGNKSFVSIILKQIGQIVVIVLFVYNTVWLVSHIPAVKRMSFTRHHAVIIVSIILSSIIIYTLLNYIENGMQLKKLHTALMYAYFNAVVTGLIYTAIKYLELDRQRKLNEKELELARLMTLKTKAELDALHSKINPHFLYNALNSIADLSITDGKKARKMTVALADLFRYSINYSQNNFSTVNDEVAMTEVYLQIEKIRFEDQLNYEIEVDPALGHFLVPRFILQPLVENAVKHGLKTTGKMTDIRLEVKKMGDGMVLNVADTGPLFPEELSPGYGVKSVYDKLDLLFPGFYEIHFSNQPRKQVSVYIQKLIKNEPTI